MLNTEGTNAEVHEVEVCCAEISSQSMRNVPQTQLRPSGSASLLRMIQASISMENLSFDPAVSWTELSVLPDPEVVLCSHCQNIRLSICSNWASPKI